MTAALAAIGAISGSTAASPLSAADETDPLIQATTPTAPTDASGTSTTSVGSSGFGDVLANAIGSVQGAQSTADGLAVQAATGNLTNVQDYLVAAEQANVDTQLTVAVRNNAVQAFQQIMAMPL